MLSIGNPAPIFSLPDQDSHIVNLRDFLGKTVVIYFYPKDMTPGCTKESCDFQENLTKFKNTEILGISRDSTKSHKKFCDKYNLQFKLLSDEDGTVCKKYKVLGQKTLFGVTKLGILRTTFVIDVEGRIKEIFEKVKVAGHVQEVLKSIQKG